MLSLYSVLIFDSISTDRNIASPPNGASRWRISSQGQLVDSSGDWDLADDIVKLQITGSNSNSPIRTPPRNKSANALAHFHDSSPLETASDASLDSSSSNVLDQRLDVSSHSRESSADTSGSNGSAFSSHSQNLRVLPVTPLKVGAVGESRNRPHSYSGGLSSSDLTRLQQAGSPGNTDSWVSPNGTPERQHNTDQPTYPSLLASHNGTPSRMSDTSLSRSQDELVPDYSQQHSRSNVSHHGPSVPQLGAPPFVHGRPANAGNNLPYRQPGRFNGPIAPVIPSATNFPPYAAALHPGAVPIANPQQDLYNMMLPTPPLDTPSMARQQQQAQQQLRGHQHSNSDPASIRDPATLALINSNLQAFGQMYGPAMAPPPAALSMFNQFYGTPQDPYPSPELAAAHMMAQMQANAAYSSGAYGIPLATGQGMSHTGSSNGGMSGSINNGPSANNRKLGLYKTELCRSWEEKGTCRYGTKCQFAHGEDELRKVQRHPKVRHIFLKLSLNLELTIFVAQYKTEICRTFWVSGSCPYGKRCCFIHTELPASGAPPGADGAPPPQVIDGRVRSSSTTSDPNEGTTSILARISAQRTHDGSSSGSVSTSPPSTGYQGPMSNGNGGGGGGPPGGRPEIKVNTNLLDTVAASKQNKSAYPTFAHNGIALPAEHEPKARSPGPVTAGPDFGRHAASRLEIVGSQVRYAGALLTAAVDLRKLCFQRGGPKTAITPNVRHSFNGSEIPLDLSNLTPNSITPTTANPNSQLLSEPQQAPRMNGHMRSGSAGNWKQATRGSHLMAYPLSSIPSGEKTASPWDYPAPSRSRLSTEENWA